MQVQMLDGEYTEKALSSSWCTDFLSATGRRPARAPDMFFIEQELKLSKEDNVLEFGAWPTFGCLHVVTLCKKLMATDSFLWWERLKANSTMTKDEWVRIARKVGVETKEEDITQVGYHEEFDKIFSVSVIEHIQDDVKALTKVRDALKPGGIFAFTTEANLLVGLPWQEDIQMRVYKVNDLVAKVSEVFKDHEAHIAFTPSEQVMAEMSAALRNPSMMRYPYKGYCSFGVSVRKPS